MNEIRFSLLQETEVKDVNNFYNRIYGKKRTIEQFKWEFIDGPAGKAIYVVAKHEGRIVGTQCAIPLYLINNSDKPVLTAKSEDTLVDPDYRGQNIFDKMYAVLFEECKKAGIHYIWGFTSATKAFKKLSFETPFEHSQSLMALSTGRSFKYLSSLNAGNSFIDKLKIYLLCVSSRVFALKRHFASSTPFNYSVHENVFDSSTKLLSDILNTNKELIFIDQNEQYLRWRIADNPYPNKHVILAYFNTNSDIVSHVMFNLHKDGTAHLIQALFHTQLEFKEKKKILLDAVKKITQQNAALIRTWDFSHNKLNESEIALLKATGFIHLNRGIAFVWKDLTNSGILSAKDLHLSRLATQGVI